MVKTPRGVVQEWVTAYNQRDAYAAAELYHEDATNFQVALGQPTVGKRAILNDLLLVFHAFPDNFTRLENLFEDGEWAILEWFGGGAWQGEFAGMAPNGRSFTLRGCGFSTSLMVGSDPSGGISTGLCGSINSGSHSLDESDAPFAGCPDSAT